MEALRLRSGWRVDGGRLGCRGSVGGPMGEGGFETRPYGWCTVSRGLGECAVAAGEVPGANVDGFAGVVDAAAEDP